MGSDQHAAQEHAVSVFALVDCNKSGPLLTVSIDFILIIQCFTVCNYL